MVLRCRLELNHDKEQARKPQKPSQNQHSSNTCRASISAAATGGTRVQAGKRVHSTQKAALAGTHWVFANKTSSKGRHRIRQRVGIPLQHQRRRPFSAGSPGEPRTAPLDAYQSCSPPIPAQSQDISHNATQAARLEQAVCSGGSSR